MYMYRFISFSGICVYLTKCILSVNHKMAVKESLSMPIKGIQGYGASNCDLDAKNSDVSEPCTLLESCLVRKGIY